jgi:hypothetical protein
MLVGDERNVLKENGGKFVFSDSWYDQIRTELRYF